MSFLNVLGKIGKTVANVATTTVGVGPVFSTASTPSAAVPVAAAATPSVSQTNGTFGGAITALVNAGTSFLSGQTHAQVDVNTGVGGRSSDPNTSSSLPSWLLPAGLVLGAVMLLKPSSSGKRYS